MPDSSERRSPVQQRTGQHHAHRADGRLGTTSRQTARRRRRRYAGGGPKSNRIEALEASTHCARLRTHAINERYPKAAFRWRRAPATTQISVALSAAATDPEVVSLTTSRSPHSSVDGDSRRRDCAGDGAEGRRFIKLVPRSGRGEIGRAGEHTTIVIP